MNDQRGNAAHTMAHLLLIYDRPVGELIRMARFEQAAKAPQARFAAEREFDGHSELEIVALSAESEEDLRRTHGRYFLTLDELAARMAR